MSVVIVTLDEAERIRSCLLALPRARPRRDELPRPSL
jgi:hypothetical protein